MADDMPHWNIDLGYIYVFIVNLFLISVFDMF